MTRDPHVPDATERLAMSANFEGLVGLLAKSLYAEPDVFVRELIQNAHDGIRRRQHLEPDLAGRIDVAIDFAARTLAFRDNGLGMNRQDIREFLSVIGSTGTGQARRELETADAATARKLIGAWGVGLLSAFVVATRVTVRTRRSGDPHGWIWQNENSTDCTLAPIECATIGTEVIVDVAPEYAYMLELPWVRTAIVRWCDLVPLPIHLDGAGPVNTVTAPWDRDWWNDADAKEAACRGFVAHRFEDHAIDIIPVEVDTPVRVRGILYISDGRIPDVNAAGMVDVHVRRMLVRRGDRELLPAWARFVRGVIDSPDLTPTAARDNVRRDDAAYAAVSSALGDIIVRRLEHLARKEARRFQVISQWHHYHFRAMAMQHADFFDAVRDLMLFETNRGLLPLPECICTPGSAGGAQAICYFPAGDDAGQFYALADARGLVAINAGHLFEEELLARYVQARGDGVRLVRLDTSHDSLFFRRPSLQSAGRYRRLELDAEVALRGAGRSGVTVSVRRFEPASLPAVLLMSGAAEAETKLARLLRHPWFAESLRDVTQQVLAQQDRTGLRLILNETHPLIRQLVEGARGTHDLHDVFCGLFLSACLRARAALTDDLADVLEPVLSRLLAEAAERHTGVGSTPMTVAGESVRIH